MNKRIKKKINERLNCKTYSRYHRELLKQLMAEHTPIGGICSVKMSKNGKHIVKVDILTDASQF